MENVLRMSARIRLDLANVQKKKGNFGLSTFSAILYLGGQIMKFMRERKNNTRLTLI